MDAVKPFLVSVVWPRVHIPPRAGLCSVPMDKVDIGEPDGVWCQPKEEIVSLAHSEQDGF